MTARRALPSDPREFARSVVPIGLIILAAAVPWTRPFVLVGLVAGAAVAVGRNAPVRWVWAAPIPVAVSLCWNLFVAPVADPGGADCTSIGSPPAVWRLTEAVLTLGVLALLASVLRVRRGDLFLRWPARWVVRMAIVGAVVLGPLGLLLGALLARPFFGTFSLDLSNIGFLVPALVFAGANGVMEELAYRGAMMAWTAKVTGIWVAVVAPGGRVRARARQRVGRRRLADRAHDRARGRRPDRRAHRRSGRAHCSCRSPGPRRRWTCRCTRISRARTP